MEAFEANLTHADDRVRLSEWLPPQEGVVPRIRLGKRWFSVLWLIPLGLLALIVGIAVAQEVSGMPAVRAFMTRYPGYTITMPTDVGPALAAAIGVFFREAHNRKIVAKLCRAGLHWPAVTPAGTGSLAGKTFVLTGTLEGMPRGGKSPAGGSRGEGDGQRVSGDRLHGGRTGSGLQARPGPHTRGPAAR